MAKRSELNEFGLPWIAHLILHIVLPALWGGIIRIARGKLLIGVLYILTAGFFGIGWIIDIVTLVMDKNYTFLA